MDTKMEEQEALEQLQRELAAKEQELAALRQECEAMKVQLEVARRREQVESAIVEFKGELESMLARWRSMKRQPYVHNHEWLLLYLYIELLHPGFEQRLRAAVKNLTGTQYQLCLLIRLGFDSNKELLFHTYAFDGQPYLFVYDKRSHEGVLNQKADLIADDFERRGAMRLSTVEGERFVGYIAAEDATALGEEDNPIVVIAKLK